MTGPRDRRDGGPGPGVEATLPWCARGRLVALGDLGWRLPPGRWLVAEIDGAGPHATPQALDRDRERQNAVNETGMVDMVRFTVEDIGRRSLATTIKAHLTRDRSR